MMLKDLQFTGTPIDDMLSSKEDSGRWYIVRPMVAFQVLEMGTDGFQHAAKAAGIRNASVSAAMPHSHIVQVTYPPHHRPACPPPQRMPAHPAPPCSVAPLPPSSRPTTPRHARPCSSSHCPPTRLWTTRLRTSMR